MNANFRKNFRKQKVGFEGEMRYNVKIIQTESYIEIYEYGEPIISAGAGAKKQEQNHEEKQHKKFEDVSEAEQLKRLKRMARTRQQTKWELMRLIDTNFDDRTSFLTLTTKNNTTSRKEFRQHRTIENGQKMW